MREGQHADHNTPSKRLSTVATSLDKISCISPAFILQSRKLKVINMRHTLNSRVSLQRSCDQLTQCYHQPAIVTRIQLAIYLENHEAYPSSFSSSTFSFNIPPGTTIPYATRNASNLATSKTFVPKSALF